MAVASVSRLAALVMLAFVSALLAVFGAFLVAWDPVPGVSVGVVLAVVGNHVIARRARTVARTSLTAAAPAVVWLAVVMTLASGRDEGDVVLTGSSASLAFVLLGAAAAAVALGRRPAGSTDAADAAPGDDPDRAAAAAGD